MWTNDFGDCCLAINDGSWVWPVSVSKAPHQDHLQPSRWRNRWERHWSTAMVVAILIECKPLREMNFAYTILSPFLRTIHIENAPGIKEVGISCYILPENKVIISGETQVQLISVFKSITLFCDVHSKGWRATAMKGKRHLKKKKNEYTKESG